MTNNKALQQLIQYQNLLGELGYTIAGNGTYYKDYGLLDGGMARIIPIFDKGVSIDSTYQLSAILVSNQQLIPIVEGGAIPLDKVPKECMSDVTKMIAIMAPQGRMPLKESFILTEYCVACNTQVSSFFRNNGQILCLECL